jgi:hypothetical protein
MRSLLLVESLDLRLSNQYILVSESPSCLRLAKMCVPGKAAVEMKSKVFLNGSLEVFAHRLYGLVGMFRVS